MLDDRRATRQALHALRGARTRRRLSELDWIDSLYKVYITVVLTGAAIFYLAQVFGSTPASASAVHSIRVHGAAALGVVVAVIVTLGLRSGGRGGPLAVEDADITHVLLAPVRRGTVLRSAAFRQARGVVFMGLVTGVVLGTLASLRLPGPTLSWLGAGVGGGVLVALTAWGAALVASGCRLGVRRATLVGAVLVLWAVADVAAGTTTSPTTQLGRLALAPLHWSPVALVSVLVAAVPVVAGLAVVGGLSLEDAQRRAGLVGNLRLAASFQDVRTVMILHRQLAQEVPRSRPWWRGPARRADRPVWRRDWDGIARWPLGRIGRVVALALLAGLALAGAREGATALVVVAGIALFLAALDTGEGLAQELDHPQLPASYPLAWGALIVRHLVVPACVLVVVTVPALAVMLAVSGSGAGVAVAALVLLPVALAGAVAGAAANVLSAPSAATQVGFGLGFGAPELATLVLVLKITLPPALVIAALSPLVLSDHPSPLGAAAAISLLVVTVSLAASAWLQSRRLQFE